MVADHIDHIRQVAGVDHVGIGSDFDGIDIDAEGLEDVSKYPALTAELLRRGWSDEDIKKILGLNILRVMRAGGGGGREPRRRNRRRWPRFRPSTASSRGQSPARIDLEDSPQQSDAELQRLPRQCDGLSRTALMNSSSRRFGERAIVRVLGKRDDVARPTAARRGTPSRPAASRASSHTSPPATSRSFFA